MTKFCDSFDYLCDIFKNFLEVFFKKLIRATKKILSQNQRDFLLKVSNYNYLSTHWFHNLLLKLLENKTGKNRFNGLNTMRNNFSIVI